MIVTVTQAAKPGLLVGSSREGSTDLPAEGAEERKNCL